MIFQLTFGKKPDIFLSMKPKSVKTKIKQLVKAFGGRITLAEELQINLSYVYKLEKGTIPGPRLFRDICNLHSENFNHSGDRKSNG